MCLRKGLECLPEAHSWLVPSTPPVGITAVLGTGLRSAHFLELGLEDRRVGNAEILQHSAHCGQMIVKDEVACWKQWQGNQRAGRLVVVADRFAMPFEYTPCEPE